MKPILGLGIVFIVLSGNHCLAAEQGGWIYKQFEATKEAVAEYQAGQLTVARFPTRTVLIGKGTMPTVVRIPGSSEELLCLAMNGALYRSPDGGKTWRKLDVKLPENMNSAFGVLKNGTMLLGCSWPIGGAHRMTSLRVFRSTDAGQTWDVGRDIDLKDVVLPDGKRPVGEFFKPHVGFSGGPANLLGAYSQIIEFSDGTIALPFYIEGNRTAERKDSAVPTYALLARSRDDGKTWDDISLVGVDFNEWGILETPDGELLGVMRGQTTHAEWGNRWKHLNLHALTGFVRSLDKGRSWSRYQIVAGHWTRDEHASNIVRLSDGTLIVPTIRRLFVDPKTYDWRYSGVRGVPVTVSYDNGVTWSTDYRIALRTDTGGAGGFPSSVVLDDDTIVTVDGGGKAQEIFATRWKLPADFKKFQHEGTTQGRRTQAAKPPSPRGSARILYVSDPSSIAINLLPDPVDEKSLRRWVDMLADSGVDMFNQEIFSQGWTVYWRSKSIAYDQRHQHRRFLPLIESGTQPVEVLIDHSHKRGMTFIAGFRVNDDHAYQAKSQGVGIAKFIEEHPEWRLKEFPDQAYYKMSEPLDFTFQGPRDFFHSVIEEVVSRFDVDGVELCFRDHGYFPHGTGRERKQLMTDLIRQIRATVDKAGTAKGKKLQVGARVYATLDECLFLGLDVPTWISDGLIDYVSPQDPMYADFNLPYEDFATLTRNSKCMLYPAMLPWTSNRRRARLDQVPLSPANQRALATTMYGAGADGITIYNHFTTIWHPPFYPHATKFFHVLRDPQRIATGERHYVFDPTWGGSTGFGVDKTSTGFVKAQKIVLDRDQAKAHGTYSFRMFEDLSDDCQATLSFRGFHMMANDELTVTLNGHRVDTEAIGRTAAKGTPRNQQSLQRDGKAYRVAPEQGRVEFRKASEGPPVSRPDPVFSTRWFDLRDLPVKQGVNRLSIMLTSSDPSVKEPIVIDEVEVWVQP